MRIFRLLNVQKILMKRHITTKLSSGADPEILKRRGELYVGYRGWPTKKCLGFKWSESAKTMLQTKVFQETFLSVFSNFLHFNESLPMKSYQFFKIYIRLYRKRRKTLMQQSMRKEKLRKFGLCFI